MPDAAAGQSIRNVAIIAHVDHGKTTLVDALLRQSGNFREAQLQGSAILDSNPLERERGITILSKNIALEYTDPEGNPTKINVIDTPGHADFGGEVERVLAMADGCLLLVDAAEGPMPQTRFVLAKAFEAGLRPIVVVNKIDKPDARPDDVLTEVFDLFVELGADDATLDFPIVYASGRDGWASWDAETKGESITPIFETILKNVPAPEGDSSGPLRLRVQTLDYSEYVGRIGVGRVFGGTVKAGDVLLGQEGDLRRAKIQQVMVFDGFGKKEVQSAGAGELVALVGLGDVGIGESVCEVSNPSPMPMLEIEPPTLTMIFSVNSSPLAGKEGKYVTGRNIRDRLDKELEKNVALKVEATEANDAFQVSGRGMMHLGILIETMRRESYELSIGKPQVVERMIDGKKHEPWELLAVDVPEDKQGPAMEIVGGRRGELQKVDVRGGRAVLEFHIPARGLIGMRTRLLTATAGEAQMHHIFLDWRLSRGEVPHRNAGVMVANMAGTANAYSMFNLQDRGTMFVGAGDVVYEGQVVAEHCRDNDVVVNIIKGKQLTNFRTTSSDDALLIKPPRKMTLEQALEYIEDDELVEVTPSAVRLRKAILGESDRRRHERGRTKKSA
jgi:GTP-binding protein